MILAETPFAERRFGVRDKIFLSQDFLANWMKEARTFAAL
jgi:hypothetical protein